MADDTAITVEGARKKYGGKAGRAALDGLDLRVARGTVHGLLGPNGAGKTTLVRVLATLLRPDAGRVEVAGHDVVREARAVRLRIGLLGQPDLQELRLARRARRGGPGVRDPRVGVEARGVGHRDPGADQRPFERA